MARISKQIKIVFLLFLSVVLLEFVTDWVEIAVGQYMLAINKLRPRIGRLWEVESLDQGGQLELSDALSQFGDSLTVQSITHFDDFYAELLFRKKLVMEKSDFLQLYRNMGSVMAGHLIEPVAMYQMFRNPRWKSVRLLLNDQQLGILFMDHRRQLIFDYYVPVSELTQSDYETRLFLSQLEVDRQYSGRVIDPEVFLKAFDQLSRDRRETVFPNYYALIQWGDQLKSVAISRYIEAETVMIAFERVNAGQTSLVEHRANPDAVASLITKLNAAGLVPPLMIPMPEGQYYE